MELCANRIWLCGQQRNVLELHRYVYKWHCLPQEYHLHNIHIINQIPNVHLKIGERQLREESFPTYLGVTFDKNLTWKVQTDKLYAKQREYLEQDF
ncbi:hypothetical protein ElyMa_003248800 [Elysia marginata]|uniref:Uncharacterized protein n=1 Tax=Elysia marginata TaxID=1093978 RepID=A0AAV4J4T2_9GAST|nr:hypothetical protein ElyMa_003248800 [Elysia marginata]